MPPASVCLPNLDVGEGHETLDINWEWVLTKLDWMITSRAQKGKTINNVSLIVFPLFSCYFEGNPFERGLLSDKRCMYCKTREADMSRSRGYLCALPTKQLFGRNFWRENLLCLGCCILVWIVANHRALCKKTTLILVQLSIHGSTISKYLN